MEEKSFQYFPTQAQTSDLLQDWAAMPLCSKSCSAGSDEGVWEKSHFVTVDYATVVGRLDTVGNFE
jgi:hypothetical protein